MKKLALALVASTVALSAANANIATGFYLGATTGFGATTAKSSGATAGTGASVDGSTKIGDTAFNIGLIGGYGWVTGCMYYGGEIGYSFENSKVTDTLRNTPGLGSQQLKRNGYFNAAFRGGYLFTPNTMFYVRLAAHWGKWSLNDSLNFDFNNANPASGSKNRLTFAPGLGLETAIHKNVYLRVEYTYEFGSNVRATSGNAGFNQGSASAGSIRTQSGKVGLAYKF